MVKYPLTETAKDAAHYVVDAWNTGGIAQEFSVSYIWVHNANATSQLEESIRSVRNGYGIFDQNFDSPSIESFKELALFRLIDIEVVYAGNTPNFHILLLQELRNAVENDFEVSEYFLTFNAVGTIIQGNATITAPFQSSASIYGDIAHHISSSEIADQLLTRLDDTIRGDEGVVNAIRELQQSLESERQSKAGKVISELGRAMQHGANAVVITQALVYLAQFIR